LKEYLFAYPIAFALFWAINWALAWFGLVRDCLPLRLYIVVGFTLAWIPYVFRTPGYWPITLLFMLGGPYALFWVLFEFPKVADTTDFIEHSDNKTETEQTTSNELDTISVSDNDSEAELTDGDYLKLLGLLLVIAASATKCIRDNF
jgi:hypothetical protein